MEIQNAEAITAPAPRKTGKHPFRDNPIIMAAIIAFNKGDIETDRSGKEIDFIKEDIRFRAAFQIDFSYDLVHANAKTGFIEMRDGSQIAFNDDLQVTAAAFRGSIANHNLALESLKELKEKQWAVIYSELNLDPDARWSINHEYQVIEESNHKRGGLPEELSKIFDNMFKK